MLFELLKNKYRGLYKIIVDIFEGDKLIMTHETNCAVLQQKPDNDWHYR